MTGPERATPDEQLAKMLADIEGYIERRAQELAAPKIEEINVWAHQTTEAAAAKAERWESCCNELRRILDVRTRQYNVLAAKHGERTIQ